MVLVMKASGMLQMSSSNFGEGGFLSFFYFLIKRQDSKKIKISTVQRKLILTWPH
uniref:Uncharacterized protein n=1 Tax=Anguilla anguilla TaxID=7936 RepID=A0A0E9WQ69_ANGAN